MASEHDEDDYMSNIFIAEDPAEGKTKKRTAKKKCQVKSKRPKVAEEEQRLREDGLSQPLQDDNIGYQILRRMGYEPGSGLGREGLGRVQPIEVQVKNDRIGVGRDEFVKTRLETEKKMKEQVESGFQERQRSRHFTRRLFSDLAKCQSACEQLDNDNNIHNPKHHWFWKTTQEEEEIDDSTDSEQIYSDEDKLIVLVDYLRDTYWYCPWCGQCYNNQDEMSTNCPGNTGEDHESL